MCAKGISTTCSTTRREVRSKAGTSYAGEQDTTDDETPHPCCVTRDTTNPGESTFTACTEKPRFMYTATQKSNCSIPSRNHFLILNNLHVSCRVNKEHVLELCLVATSFSSSSRPVSEKDNNSFISKTQLWRPTWKHSRLDPNVSGHYPSRPKNLRNEPNGYGFPAFVP